MPSNRLSITSPLISKAPVVILFGMEEADHNPSYSKALDSCPTKDEAFTIQLNRALAFLKTH